MVKKLLLGIFLGAVATSGCGRIALTNVDPSQSRLQAVPQDAPPPVTLAAADREARAAGQLGPEVPLTMAELGLFDPSGNPINTIAASAILRYARPGGARPALRTVYLDFQNRAHVFDGTVDYRSGVGIVIQFDTSALASVADAVPIAIDRVPTAQAAVALGRRAGLVGKEFEVEYRADADGTFMIVGEWAKDETIEGQTHLGAMRVFNALTSKLITTPVLPAPDAAPPTSAAPVSPPASPPAAADDTP